MEFNAAVEKFMRDVGSASTEPCLIYRDNNAQWYCDHTQNQYGDTFDWVEDAKAADPFAVTITGAEFSKGSYPFVYDKILAARLRAEYEVTAPDAINPRRASCSRKLSGGKYGRIVLRGDRVYHPI